MVRICSGLIPECFIIAKAGDPVYMVNKIKQYN
jgi:hypothetical protein